MVKSFVRDLLSLVFPERCFACDHYEPLDGHKLCLSCLKTLPFVANAKDAVAALEGKIVFPSKVSSFDALFYYTKEGAVSRMIHQLKYQGSSQIGRYLGTLLGRRIADYSDYREYTLVPVPIHPAKRRSRGYNQAEVIAEGILQNLQIDYMPNLLRRSRKTLSQTKKSREQRQQLLNSSFEWNTSYDIPEKILLIDDVVTTGSTVCACISALGPPSDTELAVACLGVSI